MFGIHDPWVYVKDLLAVDDTIILPITEVRHVIYALRCKSGKMVVAFDGVGHLRKGMLKYEYKKWVLQFIEIPYSELSSKIQFQLIQFLPNQVAMFEEILRKTCELGIQTIIPVYGNRTDTKHWTEEVWQKRFERWSRILIEACKQAKNPFCPQLQPPIHCQQLPFQSLGTCIHGSIMAAKHITSYKTGSKANKVTFSDIVKNFHLNRSVKLNHFSCIVGPEGGFSLQEETFLAQFSQSITLPTCVLRSETAATSLLMLMKCALE